MKLSHHRYTSLILCGILFSMLFASIVPTSVQPDATITGNYWPGLSNSRSSPEFYAENYTTCPPGINYYGEIQSGVTTSWADSSWGSACHEEGYWLMNLGEDASSMMIVIVKTHPMENDENIGLEFIGQGESYFFSTTSNTTETIYSPDSRSWRIVVFDAADYIEFDLTITVIYNTTTWSTTTTSLTTTATTTSVITHSTETSISTSNTHPSTSTDIPDLDNLWLLVSSLVIFGSVAVIVIFTILIARSRIYAPG